MDTVKADSKGRCCADVGKPGARRLHGHAAAAVCARRRIGGARGLVHPQAVARRRTGNRAGCLTSKASYPFACSSRNDAYLVPELDSVSVSTQQDELAGY